MPLAVTMMGSGTSSGVPVIGCECVVCASRDPRNRRTRCGLKLEMEGGVVLVDTPTDLRQQALRFGLPRVDAVLYTHSHADHILGADELRIFNFRQKAAIPCYGSPATLAALRRSFHYIFEDGDQGAANHHQKPSLDLREVGDSFDLCGRRVEAIPVLHGDTEVLGYRLGGFAYVTDVSAIPEDGMARLKGLEVLILGALRYRPHPTHFSIDEAVEVVERLAPRRAVLTHLSHEVDHSAPERPLPPGVELGYDGLVLQVA